MILFKPEHVPLILNGTKTQTRRIWWDHKKKCLAAKPRCKVGAIHKCKTMMLSKEYFARVKILRTWKEQLGDISEKDAKAEGYRDANNYFEAFFRINKLTEKKQQDMWLDTEIWCVEFERVGEWDD